MRNVREAVSSFLPPSPGSWLWLALAGLLLAVRPGEGYECGGYIEVSPSSSGSIQSPGYPGNYPNYTRCIWILKAPDQYTPQLTVNFVGEMYDSACSDYVEFRDGGPSGNIILTNCATMTSQVVTSTGRWMYVFFTSDGFSQVDGLSASYTARYVGSAINNAISNPISSCRSYEFECGNRLCLSMSYRCDGYYDCGCGADCDEDGCAGLPISKNLRMAIGFSVGISVFVLAAALGLLLEKRHNWEKEKGAVDDSSRDPHLHQSQNSKRASRWSANLLKDNRIAATSSRYSPAPAKDDARTSTPPPAAQCAIRVSEVV